MNSFLLIPCMTFLMVLVAYWIMPVKKMKAVNKELKSLLQILPIGKIAKNIWKYKTRKNLDDHR